MHKHKKLIIVGDSDFAQIAFEYFTHDSSYKVDAFVVERDYRTRDMLFGLPVVDLENIADNYNPSKYEVFIAVTYTQLNRVRTRLYHKVKSLGYKIASYVSSKAFIWQNVKYGENIFIFENNVIQPFAELGNNIILWSGNHIGHHSVINDNCFISSHVVLSGHCIVKENCFLGVNSTVANNVTIASDNWISPNSLITKDTEENKIYSSNNSIPSAVPAKKFFKVKEQ